MQLWQMNCQPINNVKENADNLTAVSSQNKSSKSQHTEPHLGLNFYECTNTKDVACTDEVT